MTKPTPPPKKGKIVKRSGVKKARESVPTKVGAPSAYIQKEHDALAAKFYLISYTDEEFADVIGITVETIHEWCKKHPSFALARATSKQKANSEVEIALRERAQGYELETEKVFLGPRGKIVRAKTVTHYAADPKAAELWLSNRDRARWAGTKSPGPQDASAKIIITGGLPVGPVALEEGD